jgi:intracellular septation protein A
MRILLFLWRAVALWALLIIVAALSLEAAALVLAQAPSSSLEERAALIKLKPVVLGLSLGLFSAILSALLSTRFIASGRTHVFKLNRAFLARLFAGLAGTFFLLACSVWLVSLFANTAFWVAFRLFGGTAIAVVGIVMSIVWARNATP